MTALLAAARAIHFASLMTIFGASAYALLLVRARLWRSPPRVTSLLLATGATLAIVSGIIWFCLVAGQMSGTWQGAVDLGTIQLAATATRFGHIFLGRFVGLLALWLMCVFGMRSDRLAVSVLAGLLLASLGPVSHAAASGSDMINIGAISDAAHLLTAGFWLGGLATLAVFVQQHRATRTALLGALRVFSIWGTGAVAVLVITGIINAISILPIAAMSLHNSYFVLLLVKVGLASLMVGLAALNRWRFAPALRTGGAAATRYLAGSVGSEMVLGLTVVAIAGVLGLMAPQ